MLRILREPKTENDKKQEEILNAINSEKIVLEDTEKKVELLKTEELKYVQNNKKLLEDFNEFSARLEVKRKELADEELLLAKVNSERNQLELNSEHKIKELEAKIKELSVTILELEKEADGILEDADEEADVIIADVELEAERIHEQTLEIQKENNKLLLEQDIIKKENEELSRLNSNMQETNNSLLADHNNTSKKNLKLKEENVQLETLNENLENNKIIKEDRIKEINIILESKEQEFKELQEAKNENIRERMSTVAIKEQLREKEVYLKEQYAIAGIKY